LTIWLYVGAAGSWGKKNDGDVKGGW